MLKVTEKSSREAGTSEVPAGRDGKRGLLLFAGYASALAAGFIKPLIDLAAYASEVNLYSHVLLVPFISGYLVWLQKEELSREISLGKPFRMPAVIPLLMGSAALVVYGALRLSEAMLARSDSLSLLLFAFVCYLLAGAILIFGWSTIRAAAFPALFLFFIVPFPGAVTHGVEMFFQRASADASALLFALTGTPFFRDGLFFTFPGLTIEVAEECSGVRSSLVLFITSLVAGHMFLKRKWSKALFAFSVIPIAIMRNALRIFVIAMLTVHVDPDIIYGPLHKRGGPLFFLASLVPFFLLLAVLRKVENGRAAKPAELEGKEKAVL
jgi:exosortase C (VPDSG-CTERM-specific)